MSAKYPRVAIDPAHCGIYKEYHDKKGRRHILDGPYVVRRKIYSDNGTNFVIIDDQHVVVRSIPSLEDGGMWLVRESGFTSRVEWETYYADR